MSCTDRRQQILSAAGRLLRHYGPGKTTIVDIAREAGIGVGSVYLEFASKDAIVEALSLDRHTAVLQAMRRAAEGSAGGWSERFVAVIDAKVDTLLSLAEEGAHAPDLVYCQSMAVQQVQSRFRDEERAFLAALLESACAAGAFCVDDPMLTAEVLLSVYGSFSPPWLYRRAREEVGPSLKATHALVLRGLLRR